MQVHLSAARGRWVEDSSLHFAGQSRVDWEDDEFRDFRAERLHALVENLTGRVNLLLTSQEHQDVTWKRDG